MIMIGLENAGNSAHVLSDTECEQFVCEREDEGGRGGWVVSPTYALIYGHWIVGVSATLQRVMQTHHRPSTAALLVPPVVSTHHRGTRSRQGVDLVRGVRLVQH